MLMPILKSNWTKRRAKILRVASKDVELGFLLTVFNFEWFLRRMILVFSKCPTIVIRARLAKCHGFWSYCEMWDECVCKFDGKICHMTEILGLPSKSQADQNVIEQYCDRRHVLVHGARGGIGFATALCGIARLLKASEALIEFAQKHDEDLFHSLYSRQNVRCGFTPRRGIEPFKKGQTDGLCPTKLMEKCPMLSCKRARNVIFNNLRKESQPVDELANVKGDALVEKVRKVAAELGLANKVAIKKAICNLKMRCEEQKTKPVNLKNKQEKTK